MNNWITLKLKYLMNMEKCKQYIFHRTWNIIINTLFALFTKENIKKAKLDV